MRKQNVVTVLAPAKLNLALDVVGLLPNGYHDLDMTMQAITLYERVVLRRSPYLNLRLPGSLVAPNNKNTAIKAALAFFHYTGLLAGVDITIYKNTPVRAGMAGGSADAAIAEMKKRGCKHIKLMVLVAAPEGIKFLQEKHPDVDIYAGALDDHLNEKGYIVPGLGDAGDRIFGTK